MRGYNKINNEGQILELLRDMSKYRDMDVSVKHRGYTVNAIMNFQREKGFQPSLSINDETNPKVHVGDEIEVSFDNKENRYFFQSNITCSVDGIYDMDIPSILYMDYERNSKQKGISTPRLYPLTHPQLAIWYSEKTYPGTNFANIAETVVIRDEIDFSILNRAINLVIMKNDGLRLRITEVDSIPRQYVSEYGYTQVDLFDFSQFEGRDGFRSWERAREKFCFNLYDSCLFYFAMFKINESEGGFYVNLHHLIGDAWTVEKLIISKVIEYYSLLKKSVEVGRSSMPSYIDYIFLEEDSKKSKRFLRQKEFWNEKFHTIPEVTQIKPSLSVVRKTDARRSNFKVSEEMMRDIDKFCDTSKNSPLALFLSVLAIYMSKISGKNDIVIGTPILNRPTVREKETVGMFINVVPVRIKVDGALEFRAFVDSVTRELSAVFKNHTYPYEYILKEYREKHQTTGNLFDTVLSFQNAKHEKFDLNYETEWHFNGNITEALTIHISDRSESGQYDFEIDYLIEYFNYNEISQMYCYLMNILSCGMLDLTLKVSEIDMLSVEEKMMLLADFNKTEADYPIDKTIGQLFEEQVEKTPENIAVVFKGRSLTYRELNEKSNQLARTLRELGVKDGSIVGIIADPSLEMIIGVLGILKSGGAYLPIDPGYPNDRIEYMLNDSETNILVTNKHLSNKVGCVDKIIALEDEKNYEEDDSNLGKVNDSNDLAYVIYTSGSTGMAKGAMIEHRSLVNLCFWHKENFDVTPADRSTKYAGFGFDASVWEIYPYLITGATIYVLDNEIKYDIKKLNQYYMENGITISFLPTHICEQFMELENDSLRVLLTGADRLKKSTRRKYKLVNNYGPTECTVVATSFVVDDDYINIPIGKPISNTEIYILDRNNRVLPIGVCGELCISGEGVARGYLNNPNLTEEKFVPNPFSPGKKMYRTGDLASWLPDGNIQFLGRMDNQVKIRGFRIELGEIESQIIKYKSIKEAAVVDKSDSNGNKYLCAYFVSSTDIDAQELQVELSSVLPEYMIPRHFIRVDKMPLTPNGKIDKKAFPEPDFEESFYDQYAAPENEIEKILAAKFDQILGKGKIGTNHCLCDMGVDSLAIMKVLAAVYEYDWNLTMQDFYNYRTIRRLSEKIMGKMEENKRTTEKKDHIKIDPSNGNSENEKKDIISNDESGIRNVLLTGATGYLGIHILAELLLKNDTSVYCVVRHQSKEEAEIRLAELLRFYYKDRFDGSIGKRIFVINGDIEKVSFGMCEKSYMELGDKVDTIIHTAALVKHFGSYSDFQRTNVYGAENVIKFAYENGTRLNHVSTISVSGDFLEQEKKNLEFTENDLYIGQNYEENVYVKSKFEAENAVVDAMRNGLDASIYRVGNLTGRFSDGHFQINAEDNRFYNLMKGFVLSGTVPRGILDNDLEFTPADYCSRAIVKLASLSESKGRAFHLFNHNRIGMSELLEILSLMGYMVEVLEDGDFKSRINLVLKDKKNYDILKGVINELNNGRGFNYKPSVHVSSDRTLEVLKKVDFEWPKIDAQYIEKLFRHMREIGYL